MWSQVVKYFLPLWFMLVVFSPSPRRPSSYDSSDESSSIHYDPSVSVVYLGDVTVID